MLRDPTIAESAKQRSLRVPLDYVYRADGLARRKAVLTFLAVGIASVYALWLAGGSRSAQRQLSPGPLSAAHASWNDDCQACHVPPQALRSDSVNLLGRLTSARPSDPSDLRAETTCLHCHQPRNHHRLVRLDDELACAACHREHGGVLRDITRADDAQCVRCHADLALYDQNSTPAFENVTRFAGPSEGAADNSPSTHPGFRSLATDPGNIKFNHWLHLQPGLAAVAGRRKLRLADLPLEQQGTYAKNVASEGLIQLDCASCHEPDSDGGSMRKLTYEQHCRACHSLDTLAADDERIEVPHGLPAGQLQSVLDGLLLANRQRRASGPSSPLDESGDLPLIPGKTLGNNLAQKIQQDLYGRRATLAAAVAAKCVQCHETLSAAAGPDILLPEWKAPNIPHPWFAHARFDHRAHRHMDCRDCHREAYRYEEREPPRFLQSESTAGNALAARDKEEVMIAGIESCARCHAPKRGSTGGARHDCAECHTYHGGRPANGQAGLVGWTSVPGGSAGGTTHASGSALSSSNAHSLVRLVSMSAPGDLISTPGDSLSVPDKLVGSASCASANCHGSPDRQGPAWQSASTTWYAHDPHTQAYQVLFTHRSREMTRRLSGQDAALQESEHQRVLNDRCTDCHGGSHAAEKPAATGLDCEACHGPARSWLHSHQQTGFTRDTPGFYDLKNLTTRAATCLHCHASYPAHLRRKSADEKQQHVVNHDLIAAGHPRLTFDLNSYQESLPAHWERQVDRARHGSAFHFQSWFASLEPTRPPPSSHSTDQPPDFAALDCFACHHSLRPPDRRRPATLDRLTAPDWPPLKLFDRPEISSVAGRLAFTQGFVQAAQQEQRYDPAVQAVQGVLAVRADLSAERNVGNLDRAIHSLRRYLSHDCYPAELTKTRQPGAYDAPSEFDPAALKPHMDGVIQALQTVGAR